MSRLQRGLKATLTAAAAGLPRRIWLRFFRLWLRVLHRQEPSRALRTLFEIDDILSREIDRVAIAHDGGLHPKHRLMGYHDFFVDRLRPGERVLDIGSGPGAVAYSMAERAGAVVTGIDLAAENVATARKRFRHHNLTFVVGDALAARERAAFETIVLSNVLEHFDERIEFLRRTQNRIGPRRWLIRVPMSNRDWRVPMREELGLGSFNDPGHYVEYTEESFREEMAMAGFEIEHLQIGWGEIWAEVRPLARDLRAPGEAG